MTDSQTPDWEELSSLSLSKKFYFESEYACDTVKVLVDKYSYIPKEVFALHAEQMMKSSRALEGTYKRFCAFRGISEEHLWEWSNIVKFYRYIQFTRERMLMDQ